MTAHIMSAPAVSGFAPLRLGLHLPAGVAIGIISPFTVLAWPFALAVGAALGGADARQLRGEPRNLSGGSLNALALTGGVLGMVIFGAIIGGLIAIAVVALASFSERAAAFASPTDRGVARILVFIVPIAMWMFLFPLLGMDVNIRIGG
jgi:hypothetical protein